MKTLYQTLQSRRAPELYGDFWFNSEPLSLRALQGNPIILFFWDYTSPHSLRMIPFINGLCTLYAEYGVICIGVHSPEFFFGKDARKVEAAVKKNLMLFPVLTDNDRLVTDAYCITAVPSLCLIDHKGDIYDIIADNFQPERIERSMQYLLRQSGYYGDLPILLNPEFNERFDDAENPANNLFLGYIHGSLGNPEGYSPELPAEYADPALYINGKFYAHGTWIAGKSSFEYAGKPNEGYLLCHTNGKNLDALIGSETPAQVTVLVDDKNILPKNCGNEIRQTAKNETCIDIHEPKLYSVLQQNTDPHHLVKFVPQQSGIVFYMFSFELFSHSESFDNAN
ncbi:MAG: redoxin domain-containing protein [Bacteroidetes bacterium]|nr:redoxin domain-containing protein [Bacteroidota bacterium]